MHKLAIIAAALTFPVFVSAAGATPVTVTFAGRQYDGNLGIGPISGEFTFDPANWTTVSYSSFHAYYPDGTDLGIWGHGNYSAPATWAWTAGKYTVSGSGDLSFAISNQSGPGGTDILHVTAPDRTLDMDLVDYTAYGDTLTSADWPSTLSPEGWNFDTRIYANFDGTWAKWFVDDLAEHPAQVPEPSSGAILTAALGGLCLMLGTRSRSPSSRRSATPRTCAALDDS